MSAVDISPANNATADAFLGTVATSRQARHVGIADVSVRALKMAAGLWFIVAVVGQLIFATYIAVFYGRAAARGGLHSWNTRIHLLLAVVIIVSGALQLTPQVRNLAPAVHRWNGRLYMLAAFTLPPGGIYMLWSGGFVSKFNLVQHVASSINGVLIMICAAMALRYALARKFAVHRRWALRLFMMSAGVWFIRVWWDLAAFLISATGFGVKLKYESLFFTLSNFGQFLVPLGVLELYLRARDRGRASGRIAMATVLFVLTLAMGVGIFVVTTRRWLPKIY